MPLWPAFSSSPSRSSAPLAPAVRRRRGPAYVDAFAGETADLNRLYDGRVGLVMAQSPEALLMMDWRLLHGLPVGRTAGAALSIPCCDSADPDTWQGANDWTVLRGTVAGVVALPVAIEPDRPVGNDQTVSNCFEQAFANATATLTDRIKANGVASPWVKAWVDGQDAVFEACHGSAVAMPALDPAAPAWLKADRAYQEAARALYLGDNAAAASDFAAIGRDQTSPWRPMAAYLTARAYLRQALATRTPANYAAAHRAINALAAMPAATFGQSQAVGMTKTIAYRESPDKQRASLDAEMNAATLSDDAAVDFRDYVSLNDKATQPPQILDWIETIKGGTTGEPTVDDTSTDAQRAAQLNDQNAFSLAHARARWAATHDPAWLIAALSLADPSDPAASALVADAATIAPSSPAYLSVAYNQIRLTIGAAPEAQTRAPLDAILARTDLSTSERNLFLAERTQVAEDLHSFAKLALRTRVCNDEETTPNGCVRGDYNDEMQPRSVYDPAGKIGFGTDAQALIDRLPLDDRAALVSDSDLPSTLRLDLALTSWTRAVLMQDTSQIDALSVQLKTLLPLLGPDWARVVATKPGPDKRFAEFFILAKMPGLTTDLLTYTRPEGKLVDWQGSWLDWMILPAGSTKGDSAPPCLESYTPDGSCDTSAGAADTSDAAQWTTSDVVCVTFCGQGAFPLRRPDFAAAEVAKAAAERQQVPQPYHAGGPATATSVWEEVLAYAKAHPTDPRSPEALYWLGHVARYGYSHDNLSKSAFDLLHQRYPTSTWAKQTKYYYDDNQSN